MQIFIEIWWLMIFAWGHNNNEEKNLKSILRYKIYVIVERVKQL